MLIFGFGLLRYRHHCRPFGRVIPLVIENHRHRTLADFRRKLVRCLARYGSAFSGVEAAGKPGAVHRTLKPASASRLRHPKTPMPWPKQACRASSREKERLRARDKQARLLLGGRVDQV